MENKTITKTAIDLYLARNFVKNSKSYQDYEKAKKWVIKLDLDYEFCIKIIVKYLGI